MSNTNFRRLVNEYNNIEKSKNEDSSMFVLNRVGDKCIIGMHFY